MKKQLLSFTLFLLLMTQAKGQTSVYHPFPDSNAVWQVQYGGYEACKCELYQNTFAGDTIVNTIHYHKIRKQGFEYYPDFHSGYCGDSIRGSINVYSCAIRYDSSQKKVFMLPKDSSNELLIYDFTLSVGDTLHSYLIGYACSSNYPFDTACVSSIDSALVGNEYRKKWNFTGSNNPVIEGIGAISGLIETMGWFEESGQLICFNQNGIPLSRYYLSSYGNKRIN